MLQLTRMGSAFRENVTIPCDVYEHIPYKDLWAGNETDEHDNEETTYTYVCRKCETEIRLTKKELRSGRFTCHKCNTVLNAMDYAPRAQCCVCGGYSAMTAEEVENGEYVCSHCGSTLRLEKEESTNNENTTAEE